MSKKYIYSLIYNRSKYMYYDKLQVFFKEKGLKQYEIGEVLGYSPAMIGRYLKGTDKINADFIVKLVKKFPDVDLQYIFSDEEESYGLKEPKPFYGLDEKTIDKEMQIIQNKIANVREYLAQKCK
jgi:transcriptional regulator with XRE-family HTH domain